MKSKAEQQEMVDDGYRRTNQLRFKDGKLQQLWDCCYVGKDNEWRDVDDFQLPEEPKERFWFNTESKNIVTCAFCPRPEYIEITAEQKAYLENKPKAEEGYDWVLKVPQEMEVYIGLSGKSNTYNGEERSQSINGIRWVKVPVKQKDRFVEAPISNECGQYYCLIPDTVWDKVDNVPLHELPSIVGFAGVRFRHNDGYETFWIESLNFIEANEQPSTPVSARFFVKGDK